MWDTVPDFRSAGKEIQGSEHARQDLYREPHLQPQGIN